MTRVSKIRRAATGLAAGVAMTAGLVLVPAVAANAGYHQQYDWNTQAQCLWDSGQWRKAGYSISVPCYYAAGKWMFLVYIP